MFLFSVFVLSLLKSVSTICGFKEEPVIPTLISELVHILTVSLSERAYEALAHHAGLSSVRYEKTSCREQGSLSRAVW